jgi:hypothetical protein
MSFTEPEIPITDIDVHDNSPRLTRASLSSLQEEIAKEDNRQSLPDPLSWAACSPTVDRNCSITEEEFCIPYLVVIKNIPSEIRDNWLEFMGNLNLPISYAFDPHRDFQIDPATDLASARVRFGKEEHVAKVVGVLDGFVTAGSILQVDRSEKEKFPLARKSSFAFSDNRVSNKSPGSRAGSLRSAQSSLGSVGSGTSRLSVNSRSSRRGRRQWLRGSQKNSLVVRGTKTLPKDPDVENPFFKRRDRSKLEVRQGITLPDSRGERVAETTVQHPRPTISKTHISLEKEASTSRKIEFFCTFCPDITSFGSRYAWTRHEEAVHVPQNKWECNRSGELTICSYCPLEKVQSRRHSTCHSNLACKENSVDKRTFYRRDNLVQHLQGYHGIKHTDQMKRVIDGWKIPGTLLQPDSPALLCIFCTYRSRSWKERVEHVTGHYEDMSLDEIMGVLLHKR